ncbi:MAG TPA: WG repeat-containing protein [Pyrinomonadaceae bacterium]|nr:WG repeat-containing protein [Pyrinomonadaceae bacterium]
MSYFIDTKGNIGLEVRNLQVIYGFHEGLALGINSKYSFNFFDKSGNVVIETPFAEARSFSEGLAVVTTSERGFYGQSEAKRGVIDKSGRIIFQDNFDKLYDFSENIAVAEKANEIFFLGKSGEISYSFSKDNIYFDSNYGVKFSENLIAVQDVKLKKFGFMNKTGDFVIEPQFECAANFSEGLARVSIIENRREYLGFINPKGEFVIEPRFDIDYDFLRNTNDLSEGLAGLIDEPPTMEKNPSFMFINKNGEVILRTEFFYASKFKDGLVCVWDEHKNKNGYIDKSGKLAVPLIYDMANDFSEGLAHVSL